MMREIERQATEAWIATPCEVLSGAELTAMVGAPETRKAVAAHDFMVVRVQLQNESNEQGGSAGVNAGRNRPEKRRKKAHGDHRNGGGGR
jgi:hypothetical protein